MPDPTQRRLGLLISKRLGLRCLQELMSTMPDNIGFVMTIDDRKDIRSAYDEIIALAARLTAPCFIPSTRAEAEEMIAEQQPAMCLAVCWYWFMTRGIRDQLPLGMLGLHNSLLPQYRGGSPLVWSLINGERKVGVSLFTLTDSMDAGDIWGQRSIEVGRDEYIADVLLRLEEESVDMIGTVLPSLLQDQAVATKQDHTHASYCVSRSPEDGEIDWSWTAARIRNFVRAQSEPYPGAFSHVESARLTVWRASVDQRPHYGPPGQVARTEGAVAFVVTGADQALRIEAASLDGKSVEPSKVCRPGMRLRSIPR